MTLHASAAKRGVVAVELQDVAEHVGHAVLAVQAQQHALGAADHHLLREQVLVDAARVVGRIEVFGEVSPEGSEGQRWVFGAAATRGQQVVDRDAMDPGADAGLGAEGAQSRRDLHEDLLGGVLGVPEHPLCQAVDVVGEQLEQFLERLPVAADGGGDELRGNLYRGHDVSGCALSTVSSRSSSET